MESLGEVKGKCCRYVAFYSKFIKIRKEEKLCFYNINYKYKA